MREDRLSVCERERYYMCGSAGEIEIYRMSVYERLRYCERERKRRQVSVCERERYCVCGDLIKIELRAVTEHFAFKV